ncbi:MAG: bis(5'-nucleosyl)-tetraphosphatase (symmetrical) YqeK [Elusimicrobia bacterium]|nr:bis(5'-nucleosyl)-tetraphosphatase (symmetrical) YqeK [Candidatus Liberimonas magnetica]
MNKLDINAIIKYLKKNQSQARFIHTLGAWRTALDLARRYKVAKAKVSLAALLHDAGKGFTKQGLIRYIRKYKVPVPNLEDTINYNPWVLHGFASAALANKRFGIKDKAILNAIKEHTIGGPDMTLLSKIIYLSDITAPDRRYAGVKKIRWLAKRNLDKAMQAALFYKTYHVLKNKKWLHPAAVSAWNGFVEKK